jgi:hypothetical protein
VQILTGGTGYSQATPPVISISGPGSGCLAVCTVSAGGIVTAITVTSPGSGYANAEDNGGGGTGATAVCFLTPSGSIANITITNGGSGYNSVSKLAEVGEGDGTGLVIGNITIFNGKVKGVSIASGGVGYAPGTTIHITAGGGTGATAIAVVENGVVVDIIITNEGENYTTPTITVTNHSGGSGFAIGAITLDPSGKVRGVSIAKTGIGYQSSPTLLISGGGGTGATASVLVGGSIDDVPCPSGFYCPNPAAIAACPTGTSCVSMNVESITVTNGGSGYVSGTVEAIVVDDGGGGGLVLGDPVIVNGAIVSIPIISGGGNYERDPVIMIVSSTGSGATAEATVNTEVGNTAPQACPDGTYCSNPTEIEVCPAGTRCGVNSTAPTACATGSFCPEGSTEAVLCPLGHYCPKTSQAILCEQGFFCPPSTLASPTTFPTVCPAPSNTSSTGSTSYLDCFCPKGTYGRVSSATIISCLTCPLGQYCPATPVKCTC